MADAGRTETSDSTSGEYAAGPVRPSGSRLSGALTFAVRLASAMNGQLDIAGTLPLLREAAGARSVCLLRLNHGHDKPRRIAGEGPDQDEAALGRSMMQVLRNAPDEMAAGTAWFAQADGVPAPRPRGAVSSDCTAIIVLRRAPHETDLVQITFSRAPGAEIVALLRDLAVAAAEIWCRRKAGLIAGMIVEQSRKNRPRHIEIGNVAILGIENSFGLSRSEFRVCSLIGKGLKPAQIAQELDLSIATVRSHLRSIYAKTDLPGQIKVLHRLHQDGTRDQGADPRNADAGTHGATGNLT